MQKQLSSDAAVHLDQLRSEHTKLEMRLRELDRHLSLSPDEQRERSELKKAKLQLKDDMLHLSRVGDGASRAAVRRGD